jgi:methylase of polypeptide subunit release factors
MKCGYCKAFATKRAETLFAHFKETGCPVGRPVWARVVEAHKRGSSGRRILAEAYPAIYKSEPMTEEAKERLREVAEERKREGVKIVKRGRRKP